jgi:hypothetical protein
MNKAYLTVLTIAASVGAISQTSADCSIGVVHAHITQDAGNASGGIDLEIEDADGEAAYLWSNGDTSSAVSELSEGSYKVSITGASGCLKIMDFFVPGITLLSESRGSIDFALHPVPTSGKLHLAIDEGFSGKRVRIYNSMGKLVMLKVYSTEFNVTRLPAGLYYFEVEGGNRITGRRKFIKV